MKPYYSDDAVTIYLGDAREVMRGQPAVDMIFTDPPFGHNNNNGDLIHRREEALGRGESPPEAARPIANDGRKDADALFEWLVRECAPGWLRGGGCCCCCCCCGGGGGPDPQFARWSLVMDGPLEFKQMVVWDKGPMGMGWHYRRSYEAVLVGMRRPGPCRWYDDTHRIENIIRHVPKQIPQAQDHPTPKPEALPAFFIGLHTKPGDVVLDPFCGGGSTLRAAKDMGRKAVGIEIDERWAEMAAKRMAQEVLPLVSR